MLGNTTISKMDGRMINYEFDVVFASGSCYLRRQDNTVVNNLVLKSCGADAVFYQEKE